jgi:hypothetical protein
MMKKSLMVASLLFASSTFASDVKFDVGMGLNYGGLVGATANMEVAPKIEVFGGLGTIGTMGYVVGARYYMNDNIRAIANYGTSGGIKTTTGSVEEIETFEGINIGVEYAWKNGWSAGLMYIATSGLDDRVKELKAQGYALSDGDSAGDIKLTFGYRF